MKVLVVGADGMIGSEMAREARKKGHDVIRTSRRDPLPEGAVKLDLEDFTYLPSCDVVYLVAAIHTFDGCLRPEAYRVNVDAPCEIARRAVKAKAFPVFISSGAVEKCGETTYARQKSFVEMVIQSLGGAIVRPIPKVTPERLPSLIELMRRVGEMREPGVYRWQ